MQPRPAPRVRSLALVAACLLGCPPERPPAPVPADASLSASPATRIPSSVPVATDEAPAPGGSASATAIAPTPGGAPGNAHEVLAVAARGPHACAIMGDRTVRCWGKNTSGELGDGTTERRVGPVSVRDLTDARQVALGDEHTCALLGDGTVRCWGKGDDGRLGVEGQGPHPLPVPVAGLEHVVEIALGAAHTCARLDDGLRCWGRNRWGVLGSDKAKGGPAPVHTAVAGVAQLVAGGDRVCLRFAADGRVHCWGNPNVGALDPPDGDYSGRRVDNRGAAHIALGTLHTCSAMVDGTLRCWGANSAGQMAMQGAPTGSTNVVAVGPAAAAAAGPDHSCALLRDKTVQCWSDDRGAVGILGTGVPLSSTTPHEVVGLKDAEALAAGEDFTCALRSDKTVVCWGRNDAGQLGDGTTTNRARPTPVVGLF